MLMGKIGNSMSRGEYYSRSRRGSSRSGWSFTSILPTQCTILLSTSGYATLDEIIWASSQVMTNRASYAIYLVKEAKNQKAGTQKNLSIFALFQF